MANRLKDKVAVITGAANGIGQGTALLFAQEGATVIAVDRDSAGLRATADTAATSGFSIDTVTCDLLSESSAAEVMAYTATKYGGVDTVVTAAGFTDLAPIAEMTLAQWQHTLKGELDIVFLPVRAAWPHLIKRGGGSVINFASVAAWLGTRNVGAVAHATGKGGVLAMTRQLALEGAAHKIRANTVSPGTIQTALVQEVFKAMPEFAAALRSKIMLDRFGTPQDVGWAIVFLASDEAAWITGTDLIIDGGATAW
jgi:NAD(P)-dependent dehydrogenase (short-subunit alcohol dehydrogenase family)